MEESGIAKRRAAAKSEGGKQYQERRAAIIAAAAEVFRVKGLAAASIDDVATAAGVDRASLYYYVGSKRELFDEVVVEAVNRNIALAESIRDGPGTATEKVRSLVESILRSYADLFPQFYVFIQETGTGAGPEGTAQLMRRFDRALIAIIEDGKKAGDFRSDVSSRLVAYAVVGMLNWTHRWFAPDGPARVEDVAETFVVLITQGLAAD